MQVDPAQLMLLALIRRSGSLAGAARALDLSPAAVTGQLARAERDWGIPLVVRGPRGARLTAPADALADAGDAIAEQCERAVVTVSPLLGTMSRRLRVGAFQAAARYLLPPALTALRHQRADADLAVSELNSGPGLELVASGELDLAIVSSYRTGLSLPPGLTAHWLLSDPMVLCLPDNHALVREHAGSSGLRLDQLADERWVVITAGHIARRQFDAAAEQAGFTPRVAFESENYHMAQYLVGSGTGVAVLARLTATAPISGAVYRELTEPRLRRDIYAVTAEETSLVPLVDVLVGLLREVADDIRDAWEAHPLGPS